MSEKRNNTRTILVVPMVPVHGRRFFCETGDDFVENTSAEYPYLANDRLRGIRVAQKEETTTFPDQQKELEEMVEENVLQY